MKLRSQHGFTLVELTIALSVVGILSLIVMNFFTNALLQNADGNARANLLSEAHQALDLANSDIRLSATADQNNRWQDNYAPGAPGDLLSWASDGDTLVLATAAENQAGTILFEDAGQYISWKNNNIYFVNNRTLYKRILAASVSGNKAVTSCPAASASPACPADRELLHDVESFTVRYLDGENQEVIPTDARSVELEVELKAKVYGNDVLAAYTTRTVFRND